MSPLLRAANPLFELIVPMRYQISHPDIEQLRSLLILAVKEFELTARALMIDSEKIIVARYVLCSFLDETISSTPWGHGGVWASRSLLVAFHNEASGGENFFLILQRLSQSAHTNIDLLELMYLCLALGMEGRYRLLENGSTQLNILRERLLHLVQSQRGKFESELSLHWHGSDVKSKPIQRLAPWCAASVFIAILLLTLYLYISHSLDRASDPVVNLLRKGIPDVTSRARVAGFLASEIAQGLVSVRETPGKSIITLTGDGVFGIGKFEVEHHYELLIAHIGDALKPLPGRVIVIGHTDNTKSAQSLQASNNDALSTLRANAVRQILVEHAGSPERFKVEGRGDTEPLVPNDSAAHRERNRRVDIVLITTTVTP